MCLRFFPQNFVRIEADLGSAPFRRQSDPCQLRTTRVFWQGTKVFVYRQNQSYTVHVVYMRLPKKICKE